MSIEKNVAFVFPGQGSQSVGMCSQLELDNEAIKSKFEVGSQLLDLDLWKLVQEGPSEMLNKTQFTQPAMLASDVAFFDVWRKHGGKLPEFMAGHSLGEYAALVCAGILDYEKAMPLVIKRAKLMQEAVPEGKGAMAAIMGLSATDLEEICRSATSETGLLVECANFNTKEQIVLSGNKEAVDVACSKSLETGAKRAITLEVSIPAHCNLMKMAAELFYSEMEKGIFTTGNVKVIQNANVKAHDNHDDIRKDLVQQLYSPVRWVDTIEKLKSTGCTTIFECGPGKVLSGLIKRIDKSIEVVSLNSLEAIRRACS